MTHSLHRVAALLVEDVAMFEFGVACEIFGLDRTRDGVPPFDFRACCAKPGVPLRTSSGGKVIAEYGLADVAAADLVVIPAGTVHAEYPADILDAVRSAYATGAIVVSVCSGAFLLAATGLLAGRTATTHWRYADALAQRFPDIRVDPDVLFVDEGQLITGAGTAAGIDACLHLVRRELGSTVATTIARRMVVPPQRDGGQRQYVDMPVPPCSADSLAPLLDHLSTHLDAEHTVADLAARARLSPRTFARRFVAETGTTPLQWLLAQRVLRARELLESTDLSVEQIAARTGLGSAALLRHHFRRIIGSTPVDYRRTFSVAPEQR